MSKVEAEKLIACDNPCDTLLNEIVKKLQSDSSQYVQIEIKDVRALNARLRHLRKADKLTYEYKHLKVFIAQSTDKQPIAFVRWTEQVDEPKTYKKRTKKEKIAKPVVAKTEQNTEQNQKPEQQSEQQSAQQPEQQNQKPQVTSN
jgi:hypothetical protein